MKGFDPMSIPQTVSHRKPRASLVTVFVETFHRPEGTRYAVARHSGVDSIRYDEPDYASEFAAYVAAVAVSVRLGARLNAPDAMKQRLIAYFVKRGKLRFMNDEPRAYCANKFERMGYDHAEAEFMAVLDEADHGIVDYAPITVYPGEYGYSGVAA
jgi:hypothetical protein